MPQLFNDAADDVLSWEFQQDFSGGENSFHRSTLIDPNQCQQLINILVRNNYEARTRPGADAIPTVSTLPIPGTTAARSLKYFDTPTYHQLIAALTITGAFGLAKYEAGAWTDITAGKPSSFTPASDDKLAMAQGIDKLLLAYGGGQAAIYDGAVFTAAGITNADCPGDATILLWHTVRMFAAGRATAPDTIYVSNLLDFSAGQWDWTKRSFRIGTGDGDPIVALGKMQGNVMAVLKRNSVWLVDTNPVQDGLFGTVSAFSAAELTSIAEGIGCVGRDAWCNFGNDILFMAPDGIRSLQRMQSASGQWELGDTLSHPIQSIIARINQSAWSGITAKKYNELALFFVPIDGSATNNAVIVWNGRLKKWLGLWTNWNGYCVEVTRFLGIPKLVFGDTTGYVNQWKDTPTLEKEDNTYTDNAAGYPSKVWSKSWLFGEPIATKTGDTTILKFSAGNTTVNISWVADASQVANWTGQFQPEGDILGQDVMPFLLASTAPIDVQQDIRGIIDFNEAYVKIETIAGWFWLKSIGACAFVNPLNEET